MPGPIEALVGAGFSEDEVSSWAAERRSALQQGGFKDNEIDAYFTGGVTAPEEPPKSFIERLQIGDRISRVAKAAATGAKEGWSATPTGLSDEFLNKMIDIGIFHDPLKGSGNIGQKAAETTMLPVMQVGPFLMSAMDSGIHAAGNAAGQIAAEFGSNEAGVAGVNSAERVKNEVINAGYFAMLQAGNNVGRTSRGPTGKFSSETVGGVAKSTDFVDAARVIGGDEAPRPVQEKMLRAYEETGIHPAELAHDAQTDPVVAQNLLSSDKAPPIRAVMSEDKVVGTKSIDVFYGAADNPIGQIVGQINGDTVKVKLSTLGEESRGKGVGVAMYEELIKYANENGLKVSSDKEVSAAAVRIYDALERRGYTVERNPEVTVDPADGKLYSEKGPVFRVSGEGGGKKPPGEPPAPPPEGSFEGAQQKILDKISVGESAPKERLTWDKFYRQAVDDLHPLKKVDEGAYELARLTRGQFGKAEHFLEHGTFDFNTYKTNGRGLADILKPARDDLNGLRAYLASKRSLEIEATGRKSGMDLEAAKQVADAGEGKYGKIAEELQGYQEKMLAYLRDSGVVSEDAFKAMREAGQNYIPFYRVIIPEKGGGAGKGLGPGNPIKKLKGSERDIIDPLESIIKNTYAFVSVAERNAVGIKVVDALKAAGEKVVETKEARDPELVAYLKESGVTEPEKLTDFVKQALPESGDTISAFRDGKRESVKVNDPELVAAFRGLDQRSTDMLTKVLAAPAKALRAGAVLSPDFIVRNVVRDFLTAFVNTGRGLFTPIDTVKGLVSAIRKDADFQDWLKGGGANSTMVALDRRYLQESLEKLTAETGLMDRAWNVAKTAGIGPTINALRLASELAENATRLGEFKKLRGESKESIQAAAFGSREVTLDFARIGASMRAYNMITAFGNAQIQGLDRIGRQFAGRPTNTLLKVAGGITLPSVLLWWANHDDPRWEEIPHWQKDMFWLVMTKDHVYRIPKPFELGVVFGSGVERILDSTIGKNPDAFDDLGKSIMNVISPNYIPTAVQPLYEQYANRSTFSDRTLIPSDQEKHLPEYQYTPYTTELSKALGKLVSAVPGMRTAAIGPGQPFGPLARAVTTPILMENYIRAWTGGLGTYALQAADAGLRKAGVLPDPILPAATLSDIPVVRAFAVRYPSASAQSIQDFYDQHEVATKFWQTWQAKAKEGDAEAMQRIQDAGGPMMFVRLDAIKETLTEHSKLVRDIYKNPTIPGDEKRQLIDGLYYNMIEVAKGGKQMIRDAKGG